MVVAIMAFPKELKINSLVYKIALSPQIEDEPVMDNEKREIVINSNRSENQMWLALWHETFHLINNEYDEKEVEFLAQSVFRVLKENLWQ